MTHLLKAPVYNRSIVNNNEKQPEYQLIMQLIDYQSIMRLAI